MKKVDVKLIDREYRIIIEPGILKTLPSILSKFTSKKNVLIVTDDNVNDLYGKDVLKKVSSTSAKAAIISIKPGEASKNLSTIEKLYHDAIELGLDRTSVIIALGGGVVVD